MTTPPPHLDDDLLAQAARLIITSQFGSVGMLQRTLRISFSVASTLMDRLEHAAIVGPPDGISAREVLIAPEQLDHVLPALTGAPTPTRRTT
jgi:DNA segregation ATPase FtsK/SpoIIIE, S-DNA-T family